MTVTYHVGDTARWWRRSLTGRCRWSRRSPPFLALRSLPADHPLKDAEIGSEPDPATFLDTLLALTAEWGGCWHRGAASPLNWATPTPDRAALAGTTTLAGCGTAKASSTGRRPPCASPTPPTGGPKRQPGRLAARQVARPHPPVVRHRPAYGINPLTGQPSPAGRWRVRNVIVWHRPNPAVGALGDKVRPSTSYIVVATRSDKRWFDLTCGADGPQATRFHAT